MTQLDSAQRQKETAASTHMSAANATKVHLTRFSSARISSVPGWRDRESSLASACSSVIPSWCRTSSSVRSNSTASSESNNTPRGPRCIPPLRWSATRRTRLRTASTERPSSSAISRKVYMTPFWYQHGTSLERPARPWRQGSLTPGLRSFVRRKGGTSLEP